MFMGIVSWIVLGLIAGFIASKIVNKRGEGPSLDILLGIIGAVIGGWFFSAAGATGVTGLNVWSVMVAVVGALALVAAGHAIRSSPRHA